MALKYRFNLKDIKLEDFKVYLVAMFKGILPKKKIKNIDDLKQFIQQKSAWVSQVTLYNYLKTRMGTKWVLHFDDEKFLTSIIKGKKAEVRFDAFKDAMYVRFNDNYFEYH